MSNEERRAPGANRFPFEAMVEVGGALGPTFEAQAINVSEEGIQLRTAYLPEPGQPLTCRFETGPSQSVLASGEVVWAHGAETGGEFGVRFTDVDAESVEALKTVCGLPGAAPAVQAGSKVRLHIDGLASPMRAKIKEARPSAVTVGSDLGFLQVGRQLELEDAQSGSKRPANIDRVEVAIDPTSNVPQLVVTLKYADASGAHAEVAGAAASSKAKADDLDSVEQATAKMRGILSRGAAQVGPALADFSQRAKTMVALLAKRRGERHDETSARRTTAPPPGGALHATGRGVVRGESSAQAPAELGLMSKMATPRRAALAGGVMVAAIVGALALKKMHHEAPPPVPPTATTEATAAASVAQAPPPASGVSAPPAAPADSSAAVGVGAPPGSAAAAPAGESSEMADAVKPAKHHRVPPFSNGPVHHGNILRLKMDGPVEAIEGASQPAGFIVKIPGRKAVEAAAPLAARDSRIAAIKASNDSAGAELTVSFRDGVPNYRVSAKGDTLVIALAPPGAMDQTVAKKDESGGRSAKHAKHSHERSSAQEL